MGVTIVHTLSCHDGFPQHEVLEIHSCPISSFFLVSFRFFFYVHQCSCVYMSVCHMCARGLGCQKRLWDALDLKLQVTACERTWVVLRVKCRSPAGAARVLIPWSIFPVLLPLCRRGSSQRMRTPQVVYSSECW